MEQIEPITINQISHSIKFDYWTEEIIQLMPLDIDSLIFSGNLLVKSYLNTLKPTISQINTDDVDFLDLYMFGSNQTKSVQLKKIINVLETIFEQNIIAGVSNNNQIYIMIQGVPRIIRIINTDCTNPNEILNRFIFAHELMYLSDQGFYTSPFAKFSLDQKQVLPNPKVRVIAKINELIEAKASGLEINSYIEEFPMIDINSSNAKPRVLKDRTLSEIRQFYKQNKNLKTRDDVFRFIGFCRMQQISLGGYNFEYSCDSLLNKSALVENFLQEPDYNIQYESQYGRSGGGFVRGSFSSGHLNKIIMDVHVEECYKMDSNKYFYFLSVNNDAIGEKFKQMVQFCLGYIDNPRTCILDSLALDPNEKVIFNVANTKPDMKVSGVSLNIDDSLDTCANLDKLCFLAIHNKPIESDQDVVVIFSLNVLKKEGYCSPDKNNFEKVLAEIHMVI